MKTLMQKSHLPDIAMPPISRDVLTAFASASGDLNPIHTDSDAARAAGLDDIIAHGMLIAAYAGRAIIGWFSHRRIRRFTIRFTKTTSIGDIITYSISPIDHDSAEPSYAIVARNQHLETKLVAELVLAE